MPALPGSLPYPLAALFILSGRRDRHEGSLEKEQDRGLNAERAARRNTDPICSPTTELRGDPEARRNPVVEIGEAHIVKRALAGRQITVKGVVPTVGGVDLPFVVDVVGQLRPCAGGSNRHKPGRIECLEDASGEIAQDRAVEEFGVKPEPAADFEAQINVSRPGCKFAFG